MSCFARGHTTEPLPGPLFAPLAFCGAVPELRSGFLCSYLSWDAETANKTQKTNGAC